MRAAATAIASALFPLSISAAVPKASFEGVELVGSSRFDEAGLRAAYGERLDSYFAQASRKAKGAPKKAAEIQASIESSLLKDGGFGYARMQVDRSQGGSPFVVFDVLEKGVRLPYRPEPRGAVPDPGGLLGVWRRYDDLGRRLSQEGTLPSERVSCPAFFCSWGASTPELRALQDQLIEGAPAQEEGLKRVLIEDRDPAERVDAVFCLAHLKQGAKAVSAIEAALTDPDERVREAALGVFTDMAVYRREEALPVDKMAALMDFPSVDDRTRGLAAMISLADHPVYRRFVLEKASEKALRILKLRNPSNRDSALMVLRLLSGKNFGTDAVAWRLWLQEARRADLEGVAEGKRR
jgi:hypothetical protein